MKQLLADGLHRQFQIGPCFRQGEFGRLHNPEYTMLEWYHAPGDYMSILEETQTLLRHTAAQTTGNTAGKNSFDTTLWEVITVEEAFTTYAGWNPVHAFDPDRFDIDLVEKVEPSLPRSTPVILKDYPAPCAALAKLKDTNPLIAERWELYLNGVEIANAYSELLDPDEQRLRFSQANQLAAKTGPAAPTLLIKTFSRPSRGATPPAGGIALGIDRTGHVLPRIGFD